MPAKKKEDTRATLCGSWTLDCQAEHPEQHRSPLALVSCQDMLCKYLRYCRTSKIALGIHSQAMESYSRCDILVIYWSLSLWDYSGCFHYPQISICLNISYFRVSLFPSNRKKSFQNCRCLNSVTEKITTIFSAHLLLKSSDTESDNSEFIKKNICSKG